MDINKLTIHALAEKINAGDIAPGELIAVVTRNCAAAQQKCNAFINYDPAIIIREADLLVRSLHNGKKLPLAGAPFALADNICTAELKTTCASRMLSAYQPPNEDGAVRKLKNKGALLAGKTNMDEFSVGASGENAFYGAVRNPRDSQRSAGSGAAAAVASGAVCLALATDRMGELRQSAAYCGVIGLKPTCGRISRQGLVDSAPSLEQAGIIAAKTMDLAAALEAISGPDPRDPTSAPVDVPAYAGLIANNISPIKLAVPENWAAPGCLDAEVKEAFLAALQHLAKSLGPVETVPLRHFSCAFITATLISAVEAFSNLSNYDGVRFGFRKEGKHLQDMYRQTRTEGFGSNLKQFLTFGALISSGKYYDDYYRKAQKMRTLINRELDDCLQQYDLLLVPTVPFIPPLLGNGNTFLLPDNAAYYTAAANLAGLPALTFPLQIPGKTTTEPVAGLQLIGKAWNEQLLLQVAWLLEQETPVRPVISA